MELPRPLANLIALANSVNTQRSDKKIRLFATIITPVEQIELIIPTGMARLSMYSANCSDDWRIQGNLQPGVYLNRILPYKDNLFIEVVERQGLHQTMSRFRCIPLSDSNPEMAGNSVHLAHLEGKDSINLITVKFQMIELGYALLKNEMVSDKHLMTTLDDALHYQLTKYGKQLQLTGKDAFRGVDIERPIDNPRVFKLIDIPSAVPLPQLGMWMQTHEEFGIYTKGFGMYYQKGLWMIYPLFKIGRYENGKRVLSIYRLPPDAVPTLHATYFTQDRVTTILATGTGRHVDGADIDRQNEGTGKRLINSDAVMGEVGNYYANGQSASTRPDSLSEYQTAKRSSGEEIVPFEPTPTNNLCKHLSVNAYNDGTLETIQWNNSNRDLLEPGMPVRFFFMSGDDRLKYKEGTLIGARTELMKDTESPDIIFREHSALTLFLNDKVFDAP